jgi:Lon protease-like protein
MIMYDDENIMNGQQLQQKEAISPSMLDDMTTQSELEAPSFDGMDVETFQNLLFPLLSCGVCGSILVDPVTLPCGNTLCRGCLPGSIIVDNCETLPEGNNLHQRRSQCQYNWALGSHFPLQHSDTNTTTTTAAAEKWLPAITRERFECPFSCPRKHHSRDNIATNFILQKSLDSMPSLQSPPVYSEQPLSDPPPATIVSQIHAELDCHICYLLLHDPMTTPCGHTFCRQCLLRSSDHATNPACPTCRSPVLLPTSQNTPTNILIDKLIRTLFPSAAAERAACEGLERHASCSGIDTPIFICTLALPSVTCFLHIFEPRYRLMLRRCMAGDRKFGMVLPRSCITPRYIEETQQMQYITPPEDHGELPTGSRAMFMRYGTMLEILGIQMLPDGRSLVETVGRERFSIHEWSVRDGYVVARTTPVPDLEPMRYIPPTMTAGLTTSLLANTTTDSLSTNELIYLTKCFVQSLRNITRLSTSMSDNEVDYQLSRLDMRGDAVRFGWWVASKMPLEHGEAYSLLLQGGVRELYCLLGRWIGDLERQSW